VVSLLRAENLGRYAKLITENQVDGATLECVETLEDVLDLELEDLRFKPAVHAKKLFKLILKWKDEGLQC
jgi:hypothetical protein